MKHPPTTFELAQLAALASPPYTRPKNAVRRAMDFWLEAEEEIAGHGTRADYLRCMLGTRGEQDSPIFTDTPEEWSARIKGYPGDEGDVIKAMWNKEYPTEEVEKQLFKNRTYSRDTRKKLLLQLVRASIHFDIPGPLIPNAKTINYLETGGFLPPQAGFPIHRKNVELAKEKHQGRGPMQIPANEVYFLKQIEGVLSKPTMNAHQVRWAVEVRQKQLADARSRDIPQSIRTRRHERDKDENIQVKRPYRQ